MKYTNEAEQKLFYNFVFYETDKGAMHVFCPNCLREYEAAITKNHSVAWLKKNYKPCECFSWRGTQPSFKHARHEYGGLNRVVSVAEFENRGNGEAALCVYWFSASFSAENYDAFGYAFKRYPVYDEKKVIEFVFRNDGTAFIKTRLYIPMCAQSVAVGEWRVAKRWHYSTFMFDIIPESIEELKGTCIERYVPEIERFLCKESEFFNVECVENETVAAWLLLLHTSAVSRKLWKAGYERLVFNKTIESMCPGREPYSVFHNIERSGCVVNYSGKTIEKILRMPSSKLDCAQRERGDVSVSFLRAAQKVYKFGLEVNEKNVRIAWGFAFDELIETLNKTGENIPKAFKFIRHEMNKGADPDAVVSDYRDYLKALIKLGTKFTDDVVFPSRLKESHDRATSALRNMTSKIKEKSFTNAVSRYTGAKFTDGTFTVSVVGSIRQLNVEAARMHNCSATYADRIIEGNSVIFKIRENAHPRTAFCMLEYSPKLKRIVQNRGIRNGDVPEGVKDFAETWVKKIMMPLERKREMSR